MLTGEQVVMHAKQGTQDMLEHKHLSLQGRLTCEDISTQCMLKREARNHSRHVGT